MAPTAVGRALSVLSGILRDERSKAKSLILPIGIIS